MAFKILMVDDHPTQLEGYKVVLEFNNQGLQIEPTLANSCEEAYHIITDKINPVEFDMVFLDRSLPPYHDQKINSGEDLAILVQEHLPNTKIVMLTSHAEAFILYNIVKKINPNGLLVKSDFSGDELLNAFEKVVNNQKYHSETVIKSIKELLSREDYLDSINREIITLLSQGIRTKSMPEYINLSHSAIEKRKVQIKDYFCIDKGSDEDIIKEAKRLGFI